MQHEPQRTRFPAQPDAQKVGAWNGSPIQSVTSPEPRFGVSELMMALFINVMFAFNMVASKVVVDASAPFSASAARMGIVFLLCIPALRLVKGKVLLLALYGAINGGIYLLLFNLAMNSATNVGVLSIAGQLSVPFSLLLGVVIFGERLSPVRIGGITLAMTGVAVLGFDPAIADEGMGTVIIVSAAFLWAVAALIQRKLTGVSAMNAQAWSGLMGVVVLAPFSFWLEPGVIAGMPEMPPVPLAWLAFLCIGSTIAGQGAMAWLLQRHAVSTVTPLLLAAPILSALIASLYFGTAITLGMIIGGAIALAGVAIIAITAPKTVPPPLD